MPHPATHPPLPSPPTFTPAYWTQACQHLSQADPVLQRLIATYDGACLQSRGDAFTTLARSIVGQQISVKAAQAVWDRFAALAAAAAASGSAAVPACTVAGAGAGAAPAIVTPHAVLALETAAMRAAGLSARKVEYVRDLASHFADGRVQTRCWQQMSDEAIIAELVAIRGIGRWTAEMFLIFHLLRPDVLPLDDIGLLKAIRRHYFDGQTASRSTIGQLAQRWQPWRSVATWYLWRDLDPVPVAY